MLLMVGFYLSFWLSNFFSLHPSQSPPSPIFSGSSDHPPSLGGERLRSKLPPVRPDPQAGEQVPRQICRLAREREITDSDTDLRCQLEGLHVRSCSDATAVI